MQGFFTKQETESKTQPEGYILTCHNCGLYKDCKSPKMAPYGKFKKGILNIGEAPGEVEDSRGKPWQGKTGRLLQRTYDSLGIDLFEDCLNTNACLCRPLTNRKENRSPSNIELDCCRKTVLQTIYEHKPKVIVALGNAAMYSLLKHRWKHDSLQGITRWRGWTIPDQDLDTWLCPTFHPSYVERAEEGGVERTIWKRDLKQAISKLDSPIEQYIEPKIDIIEDLSPLENLMSILKINGNPPNRWVAIDYETTGLKPHAPGHRIVCVAIATSENHAYAFMLPNTPNKRKPLVDLLLNPGILKIAHNQKFEHAWSLIRLKTEVQSWGWDTMLASHVWDNRRFVTSLAFQTYVNFGIIDYKSLTDNYLEAKDKTSANSINQIFDLISRPDGKTQLLKRCALDTIYEYRLAMKQQFNLLPF